jgi:hypothetical protein
MTPVVSGSKQEQQQSNGDTKVIFPADQNQQRGLHRCGFDHRSSTLDAKVASGISICTEVGASVRSQLISSSKVFTGRI